MCRTVLVGFDSRPEAADALALGRALAELSGATLLLATVLPYGPTPALGRETFERWLAEDSKQLFDPVLPELEGLDSRVYALGGGSPARKLHELAEDQQVDLIVVGSTHRGALGRVLPGSVGERLLNGAPCAVAIAPRGFADREHFGLGVIGVAYDGTEESKLALAEAERLAGELGASLRLIGVVPHVRVIPSRIGHTTVGYADVLRRHFRDVLDLGASRLPDAETVETMLEEGDPAAALAARGVELDLLVMGSRGYGPLRRVLLGGVSAEVMRTAPCPVIVVPRASASANGQRTDESSAAATAAASR